jgi:hypothetical protein
LKQRNAGLFKDHRNLREAIHAPFGQSFESVDDLEMTSVIDHYDSNGEVTHMIFLTFNSSRAKICKTGVNLVDWKVAKIGLGRSPKI